MLSNKIIQIANAIRALSIDMVHSANSGHPGMPLGMADVAAVLFHDILRFNPSSLSVNRDRFILSNGHGSALLYATLYLFGYDFSLEDLQNFRQLRYKTHGHPEMNQALGIETTTGPLGQGIANAVGIAISQKVYAKHKQNNPARTFVFCGDGCLQEGISHEAASLAGHLGLDNLVVLFDDNGITIDGPLSLSSSEDVTMRFQAYGWNVLSIDGHDHKSIHVAINTAVKSGKPSIIRCNTIIGCGSTKAGTCEAHGTPLSKEDITALKLSYGFEDIPFSVPSEIIEYSKSIYKLRTQNENNDIEDCDESWKLDVIKELDNYQYHNVNNSTRVVFGQVLGLLNSKFFDKFIGGSADLTPSNNTYSNYNKPITKDDFSGNYLHYGIREHAMAGIANGIALFGKYTPYVATFLVFSDYMRPAVRLSAMMQLGVIYIFTHDSISLAEDGPTHQPIEHLSSLRAIPNLLVFRPASEREVVECLKLALRQKRPSAFALSRQSIEFVSLECGDINNIKYGAYVVERFGTDNNEDVIIFATGSEVALALKVRRSLAIKNIKAKVVSIPCFELFYESPQSYQDALLNTKSLKIGLEFAKEDGWHKVIGKDGLFIGVNEFGASGKMQDIHKHFDLMPDQITERIINHYIAKMH